MITLSGCAVINEKQEILVVFDKEHKHYQFPGGTVKENEPPKKTAQRELKEELRVEADIISLAYQRQFKHKDREFSEYIYISTLKPNQTPKILEPEESESFLWLLIKDYSNYTLAPNLEYFCKWYIENHST